MNIVFLLNKTKIIENARSLTSSL